MYPSHFVGLLQRSQRVDIRQNSRAMQRLLDQCERAKINVGERGIYTLEIEALTETIDLVSDIDKEGFLGVVKHLLDNFPEIIMSVRF